jgi:hypothetical protein
MNKKRFYVYIHRDPEGKVFYVGKGEGSRAWEKEKRHSMWKRYIKRFNDKYYVEIYRDNLSEEEALELEEELMSNYGGQLINWSNLSLDGNWKGYEKQNKIDKEINYIICEAKEYEKFNIEKAINLYVKALNKLFKYQNPEKLAELSYYSGLSKEVQVEWFKEEWTGNITILDRLTLCLKKLERYSDINYFVNKYIKIFPGSKNKLDFKKIQKRILKK